MKKEAARHIGMRSVLIMVLVAVMSVSAYAATKLVSPSTDKVELKDNSTKANFNIIVNSEKAFAGVEFGLKPSNEDVRFKSVSYNGEFAGKENVKTEKGGVVYFGVFDGTNVFKAGEHNVATAEFEYAGKSDAVIKLKTAQVVRLDENGEAVSEKVDEAEGFEIKIVRKKSTEDTGQSAVSKPTGKVTILNTIANSSKKTNDVIWDKSKVKGAKKYEINWRSRGASKWASRTVGNKTRGTITGLSIGGLYEIRVRPVAVSANGKNKASGQWSKTVYRYFHTTGKINLESKKKGTFTIRWAKNSAATNYQVMFTTNKSGAGAAKNISTVSSKATSFTKGGLKSGRTYYVQIRELRRVKGTTYVGNISKPVPVKVK